MPLVKVKKHPDQLLLPPVNKAVIIPVLPKKTPNVSFYSVPLDD